MRITDFFLKKFSHWQKNRLKMGGLPLWVSVLLAITIFSVLWTGIAMGGLRVFIPHLFSLLGSPFSSKTYLVVFQNDTELRPTGGFISAYGVVEFTYGFIPHLKISDVYGDIDDHAYVAPPYPMEELLANEWYQGYTFRDANYNPDFPSSADDLVTFYRKINPDAVFDGVIAVDFSFIENVTKILGGVTVDGVEITGENLFEVMEETVSNVDRHSVDALANRKNILRDFAKKLLVEVVLSPLDWRKISDAVVDGLEEKDLLLSFTSPSLRRFTTTKNWQGSLAPMQSDSATDFLALVEANLGGMKSNRYITRDITYTVDLSDVLQPRASVSVQMTHNGNYNEPLSGPYTGYVRTYVARGSSDFPDNVHPESSVDFAGWGEVVQLNPGESTTLLYSYALPQSVLKDDFYSLFLRKQPGTHGDHIRITVRLPQGESAASDVFTPKESVVYYEGFLDEDLLLSLTVLPDTFGPRVSFHEITDLNRIELHFNEKVDGGSTADPLNYAITDLDQQNRSVHDTLSIVDIEHFDKTVILHTKGMTNQPEEFYTVSLQNIKDFHGNFITPNPREVTVVQRL